MQRDGGVIFSRLAFVYSDPESFMGCESAAEDSSGTRWLEARSKYPFSTVQLADAQCSGYKASAKG